MSVRSVLRTFTLSLIASCILLSCSTKYGFSNSSVVPAATGSVKVKKDNNDNYRVRLHVNNLATPDKLTPSRRVYIVWVDTDGSGAKNIGQLRTSSGLFSSGLKSSLETVTPFKPRSFFITAEDDATIQYPGSQVVLKTD